jgi:hypothetical protein
MSLIPSALFAELFLRFVARPTCSVQFIRRYSIIYAYTRL